MDRHIAMLPSFCSIHHLQYANFKQSKEWCKQGYTDGCVQNFDTQCCSIRTIAVMYVSSADLLLITAREFSMVGGYMEDLKNQKTAKIGVGACLGMGTCPRQFGSYSCTLFMLYLKHVKT